MFPAMVSSALPSLQQMWKNQLSRVPRLSPCPGVITPVPRREREVGTAWAIKADTWRLQILFDREITLTLRSNNVFYTVVDL